MKKTLLATVIPALLILGLDGTRAHAQPAPVAEAPAAPSLRTAPLDLDERELEQAINAGQTSGPRTEWAIAPAPAPAPRALPPPAPTPSPVAATPVPPAAPASAGSVPHFSGGVGHDERTRMEAVKSQFNLRLLFAISGAGSYLSGVKVLIQDTQGNTLLDTVSNGPWFFAQLPPGTYNITLDNQGQVQKRQVSIPPQRATEEKVYWTASAPDLQAGTPPGWNLQPPAGMGPGGLGTAPATALPLSPQMTRTGIPYLSGGEDPEELSRMEASLLQFNLRLNFTIHNASNKSPVIQVRIQDIPSQANLVEIEAKGPLFLARLPAGQYLVTITYAGQEVRREMRVPGYGLATATFDWTH